jgi:rubrerythrin
MPPAGRRRDFQHRLTETTEKLKTCKAQIASLQNEVAAAVARGDDQAAVDANKHLALIQQQLPDLEILQSALQRRMELFRVNEAEAQKLRDEVHAIWEEIRPKIDALIRHQREVDEILKQIAPLADKFGPIPAKHMDLVGETLQLPIFVLPGREILNFVSLPLTPLEPWRYISEAEKQSACRKAEAEERARQEKYGEVARKAAPKCERCDAPMTLRTGANIRGSQPGYWAFECPNCSMVTQKFVAMTGGD